MFGANYISYECYFLECILYIYIFFITDCNWAYARWQCYINDDQYVNSNTQVVQNTEYRMRKLQYIRKEVIHKKTVPTTNWKYREIEPGPSKL
jgi:hypothetical protein